MILVADHNCLGDIIILWTVHAKRQDAIEYVREEGLQGRLNTALAER